MYISLCNQRCIFVRCFVHDEIVMFLYMKLHCVFRVVIYITETTNEFSLMKYNEVSAMNTYVHLHSETTM
jgi:hypothetical protein